MLIIIHGNIKTMEGRDYEDGFLQIKDGKIAAVGRKENITSCIPAGRWDSNFPQWLTSPEKNGKMDYGRLIPSPASAGSTL